MNIKVTQNLYGNFRGFKTGQQSEQLGCNDFDAKLWMWEIIESDPTVTVLPKSHFSREEIEAFGKSLGR